MLKVTLNGNNLVIDFNTISTFADLVEYIKATINPNTMIHDMTLDGQALSESIWNTPISFYNDSNFDVTTGDMRVYLSERFNSSGNYLQLIKQEFDDSKTKFVNGITQEANEQLALAVDNLNAFVNWYCSLLNLLPEEQNDSHIKNVQDQIGTLTNTCETLVRHQLQNSWWAVSQTVETTLNPQLEELKRECETFASTWN